MTQKIENDTLDNCIIPFTATIFITLFVSVACFRRTRTNKKENAKIFNRVACCRRNYEENKTQEMEKRSTQLTACSTLTITVVCKDGLAQHKNAFQSFAANKLQCKVKWLSSKTKITQGSKLLLLCNVTSRIPDDLEDVLKDLRSEGETLEYDIWVVAMHRSEGWKEDYVSSVIEASSTQKNRFHLINIFYCGNITFECAANDTAKDEMEKFLKL